MTLLEAREISVAYGGVVAIDNVSFDLHASELLGLIGANGAGKTTLIDALSGFVSHRGTVQVQDLDLTGRSATWRARHGIGRTFQAGELFEDLSVIDNLLVAAQHDMFGSIRDRDHQHRSQCVAFLEQLGIADFADAPISALTLGQTKLVGVARALALRPRVLLLDEPAAGLSQEEGFAFAKAIRSLLSPDLGILMIDHDAAMMFAVCDRIMALDVGQMIASGTPDEVRNHPRVIEAYLGIPHA